MRSGPRGAAPDGTGRRGPGLRAAAARTLALGGVVLAGLLAAACPSRRAVEPTPRKPAGDGPAARDTAPATEDRPAPPAPDPVPAPPVPPPAPPAPPPPPPPGDPAPEPAPPRPSAAPQRPDVASPPTVRIQLVAVMKAGRAPVRVDGAWTLRALDGAVLASGAKAFDGELRITPGTADLGAFRLPRDGATLTAGRPGDLRVGAKRYPGTLRVARGSDGVVRAAVETDIETYLEGVVLGELPADFPREARRVQAILARTYALTQPGANATSDAVLVDDTGASDQEYAGSTSNAALASAAREAVASTRGVVICRDGRPIRAWYHSTCGGRTCRASAVFRVPEAQGIQGVECGSCTTSPRHRWDARVPGADVVKAAGLRGALTSFAAEETTDGGRAVTFRVAAGGKSAVVPAADLRLAVGASKLRSVWIDRASVEGGDLVASGRGWGHGVGVCQWGAKERAAKGATAEAILAHYFPGTDLRRRW